MYNFPRLIKITFQKSLLLFFCKTKFDFVQRNKVSLSFVFMGISQSPHTKTNLVERIIAVDYTTLPHQNKKCLF